MSKIFQAVGLKISVCFELAVFVSMVGLPWSRYSSVSYTLCIILLSSSAIYHLAHIEHESSLNQNKWIGTHELQSTSNLQKKDREYLDNIKFLEKDKPNTISYLSHYCVSISEILQKGRQ